MMRTKCVFDTMLASSRGQTLEAAGLAEMTTGLGDS